MIKKAVVNPQTPSVVSGARGTVVKNGEAVRRDEVLPAAFKRPMSGNSDTGKKPR